MNSWSSIPVWLMMTALLGMSYRMSIGHSSPEGQAFTPVGNNDQVGLTHQQRQWSEKAVERYAESQERKWRRWNEKMFRRIA